MSIYPQATERMSRVDHAWLRMDEPDNRMVVNALLRFDERLDVDRVRSVLERRLLSIGRFRRRIVKRGRGRPMWEDDPDFDLARHVVRTALPPPGNEAALRELLGELTASPIDVEHPPWRFHVIDLERGRSAVLCRIHHCVGDGIALTVVLLSMTDFEARPDDTAESAGEAIANPFARLTCGTLGDEELERVRALACKVMPEGMRLMTFPVDALRSTPRLLRAWATTWSFCRMALRRPDRRSPLKGPLGMSKRVAWSAAIPLDRVAAIRRRAGGTLNDVLTTAISGGLRRYLADRGDASSRLDLRAVVPVNLRPLDSMAEMGNAFGLVFLNLPIGIADPTERLAEVGRRMRALRSTAEPATVLGVLRLLGSSPRWFQRWVVRIFGAKATTVLTNVPGPNRPLYFGGKRVRDLLFWVPQSGRLGIGISILSYDGRVRLGLATDAGLIPDAEAVVRGFEEELDAMHETGGARHAGARTPA